MKWARDGQGDVNDVLHTMLTLNHYGNDPWFFENLWSRDKNRVTRAVAAYFAVKGFLLQGIDIRPQLEKQLIEMPHDPWLHEIRSEEFSDNIQSIIGKAILAWDKRSNNHKVDASPVTNDEK